MAFDTYDVSTQVITATDYDKIKLKAGEAANTDNFNRNIVDSINRDAMMEAAVTYMARSSSLFTTTRTKFLSHCEGDGVDVIGYNAPVLTTDANDVFMNDDTFIGAAWAQSATSNMMSAGTSDSSLKSTAGWTITNPSEVHAIVASGDSTYTEISTLGAIEEITPGNVVLASSITPITGSSVANTNISASMVLDTNYNMVTHAIQVEFRLDLLDASNTILLSKTNAVQKAGYDGMISIENVAVPETATKFQVFITVKFLTSDSRAAVTVKNVMVQAGGVATPYVLRTRQQCTARYNNVVDGTLPQISALCWTSFKRYSLATHAGIITPLAIRMDNLRIGGCHKANAGESLTLSLYIEQNGEITYGPEFTLNDDAVDEYVLTAIRIRNSEETEGTSIVEFSVAAKDEIHKSTLEIDTSLLGTGDLIVGTDMTNTEYFNGPVSEVRYDEEWINDLELYVVSLTKKAFRYRMYNDLYLDNDGESVLDVLDGRNTNLILNPSGELAFIGWYGYPVTNFITSHDDVLSGNCFCWLGTAKQDYKIYSDAMKVSPNTQYTFRARMYSAENSSGSAGIGIDFYSDKAGTNFISTTRINMTHTNTNKYYTLVAVAPETAASARVYMFVDSGLKSTRLTWSKLKLEQGEASAYTNDSGPGYALYYGEDTSSSYVESASSISKLMFYTTDTDWVSTDGWYAKSFTSDWYDIQGVYAVDSSGTASKVFTKLVKTDTGFTMYTPSKFDGYLLQATYTVEPISDITPITKDQITECVQSVLAALGMA